ncbi:MAG: N-acetyltransferase family protein [Pseudomonadota bacterium]
MKLRIVTCMPDTHAVAVREIFNDAIINTTALYEYKPWTQTDVIKWFGSKASSSFPVIAAVDDSGTLLGFASYGQFRARPAYKYTVEHSVYVHREHRRRGAGRALLQHLIELARGQQLHVLVGGIDVSNIESIALHEQLGFRHAGTITQAGYKFGRWLDLGFYQLTLTTPVQPQDG